jgi:RecA-family ATPase
MSAAGFDFDEIKKASLRVNGTNGHSQFEPEEEQPNGGKSAPLLRWFGDEPIKQPPWLVQGMLPEKGVALIAGQWASGKTYVGIDLAVSVALGLPFAGAEVCRRGGTLWLAAEGDADVEPRVDAALERKCKDLGRDDIPRLPFAKQAFDVPSLTDADALPKLLQMAEEAARGMRNRFDSQLVLIFCDTVAAAACFDDENSASETQKVMNVFHTVSRETGSLVIGLDHYGKMTETGIRGSSAKATSADAILATLADKDGDDGKYRNRRLVVSKLRGGPAGTKIPFKLGDGGTAAVVDWADAAEPETP